MGRESVVGLIISDGIVQEVDPTPTLQYLLWVKQEDTQNITELKREPTDGSTLQRHRVFFIASSAPLHFIGVMRSLNNIHYLILVWVEGPFLQFNTSFKFVPKTNSQYGDTKSPSLTPCFCATICRARLGLRKLEVLSFCKIPKQL